MMEVNCYHTAHCTLHIACMIHMRAQQLYIFKIVLFDLWFYHKHHVFITAVISLNSLDKHQVLQMHSYDVLTVIS